MPDLASNVLLQTSHSSKDSVSLLVTMLRTHKSGKSAKSSSSSGRMATKTRQALSVSQRCTRNCQSLHVRWPRDRKSCRTIRHTIPMETTPLPRQMLAPVLLRVSTRQAQHIAQSRLHQPLLQALRLSSPRADTRTRTTPPSIYLGRKTT